MRRPVRRGLIAGAAALLIAAAGAAAWMGGTTAGARWLLDALSRRTPLAISARSVEGRLWGGLRLGGVHLALASFEADAASLAIRWQPLGLLRGSVAVAELRLAGLAVRDTGPAGGPPDLTWPRVSALAMLSARIDRLEVSGLTYRGVDGSETALLSLSSSLRWDDAVLTLSDLAAEGPFGRMTGSIAAGFLRPSLRADIALAPAGQVGGMDRFTFRARFLPGRGDEQLAGSFGAAGAEGRAQRWELTGEAAIGPADFRLRKLRLTRPGLRGALSGEGTITPARGGPRLAFDLAAAEIEVAGPAKDAAVLSGTLALSGTPADYRGSFAIDARGTAWRTARLAGRYAGDGNGVRLSPLRGALLGGALEGNLDLRWSDGVSLEGVLRGRGLDPARISPGWAGMINADLSGNVRRSADGSLRGEATGRLRESRLHGRALTGEVSAAFGSGDLHVRRLLLSGKGFSLHAAGRLGERLAFGMEAADLGRLIPGAAGSLAAEGWVRWADGRPAGTLRGRGTGLAAAGLRIGSGQVAARLGEGEGFPLHIALSLRKAAYEGLHADSVTLEADGTAPGHTIDAALQAPGAEARIGLTGAYREGAWAGSIVRLSGRDRVGPWRLAAPAGLTVAGGRVSLAPLALAGAAAERIEVSGEFVRGPSGGSLQARWGGLNLARLNPWLEGATLSGASAGDVRVRFPAGGPAEWAGRASARGGLAEERYGIRLEEAELSLEAGERGTSASLELRTAGGGTLKGSFAAPGPGRLALPETGEVAARWAGIDAALLGRWLPAGAGLDGRLAGRLGGRFLPGGRAEAEAALTVSSGKLRWSGKDAALSADIRRAELTCGWQGHVPASPAEIEPGQLSAAARVEASGSLTLEGRRIGFDRASLSLEGNDRGLHAGLEIALAGGASLKGRFASPQPAGLAIPAGGAVSLEWAALDAALLRPWLPEGVGLDGTLAGNAAGELLSGGRFSLHGGASLSKGAVRWLRPGGEIKAGLAGTSLSWEWRDEALRGDASLTLTEYGQASGTFRLPIAARFPVAPAAAGPLDASFRGQFREQGLLSALFAGLIRESRAEIDADLRVGGTWRAPEVGGSLALAGAGAYLPSAGIQVSDLRLAARLEKGSIRIDSFRAVSGPGRVEGQGVVRLKGAQVVGYEGSVTGERFRVVYLPELQVLATPRLRFDGTAERLAVRGEVVLPELIINGPPTREVVLPSRDVIREGAPKPVEILPSLALDVQVRFTLGERVLVKAEGIDAQLGGSVDLAFRQIDKVTSTGEIRVVTGRYRAYGADLEIVRGRLLYAGGTLDRPTLDILALRTFDDVRAGITAVGSLRAPTIKLYAEPPMPDVDILSYILFGHPFGTDSSAEQAGTMAQAAGMLLSRGQSALLQDQIKNRLGLSTLELRSAQSPGLMGYRQLPTTPGSGQTPAAGSVSQTMLTVGKYLTPRLYFSYGRSLFTGGNLFRLRYDLFRRWQVETQAGSTSGVDLYYKIEFD